MEPSQPLLSAHAPWTKTTVGLVESMLAPWLRRADSTTLPRIASAMQRTKLGTPAPYFPAELYHPRRDLGTGCSCCFQRPWGRLGVHDEDGSGAVMQDVMTDAAKQR